MEKKILITSDEPKNYSTRRLMEEIEKRSKQDKDLEIKGEVLPASDFYAYLSSANGHDRIYKRGENKTERLKAKEYIAIIPRGNSNFVEMFTRHVNKNLGIFTTASDFGQRISNNKFYNSQFLSHHRFRVAKQILAHQPTDHMELIKMLGGLPVVAKLQKGSAGQGIMILNEPLAASTALRSFEKLGADVVLQEFISTGEPASDLRIFVVGAETEKPKVFAYRRFAVDSDFRSNYSISKAGEPVEITEEEKEMAIDASKLLGLGVCGVDILRSEKEDGKPYIIETNSSPGLEGVEKITGENVAGAIIDYVLENYKRSNVYSKALEAAGGNVELWTFKYLAQKALENIKAANTYSKAELYTKNYKAQDYMTTLIKKLERLISDEK
jgi:ribosomal protein S6--L-glutamate ligase